MPNVVLLPRFPRRSIVGCGPPPGGLVKLSFALRRIAGYYNVYNSFGVYRKSLKTVHLAMVRLTL